MKDQEKSAQEMKQEPWTEEDASVRVPTDEWTAAALAHASVLLTLALAMAGGVGVPAGLAVPVVMYFGYRERSRFVALHALQAFLYQIAGLLIYTVGAALLVTAVSVAWTISGALAAVLVGFLLMPSALVLTVLMVLFLVGGPIAWVGYGLYAAYQTYHGSDFRYRVVGDWLEREVKA